MISKNQERQSCCLNMTLMFNQTNIEDPHVYRSSNHLVTYHQTEHGRRSWTTGI